MSQLTVPQLVGSLVTLAALSVCGCGGNGSSTSSSSGSAVTAIPGFTKTPLVSDQAGVAPVTDPNLVNPWGIAFSPSGPFWLADNNSNLATIYSGGNVGGSTTNLSPSGIQIPFGNPTGQVYNATTDFTVTNGTTTSPALFIFSSETGWIDGWSPSVNASSAEAPVDLSGSGAVFKGLAIGSNGTGNFLYATDFANAKIDVFDRNFNMVTMPGGFADPTIPAGFAPFGIQAINGSLFVTYAKQDSAKHDDVKGKGNGYVDQFDMNGNLIGRVATKGNLNSPWGLAMAPASFGPAAGLLLVGNFGDGLVNVYDPTNKSYVGTLADATSTPIVIDGLWGLAFGNGGSAGDTTSLYFTSGPGGESHGVFGRLNAPATGPTKNRTGRR